MTLAPGMRIGAYDIVSLLGAGGMGAVYRARGSKLKREVAIKVLWHAAAVSWASSKIRRPGSDNAERRARAAVRLRGK